MTDNLKLAAMVREISATAPRVALEHAEQQAAFESEREATKKLLSAVIEMALPALPAISNRLDRSNYRGLTLFASKDVDDRPWNLHLLEDGRFVEEYDVFEDSGEWEVKAKFRSVDQVVKNFETTDLVAKLHAALTRQAGKRKPSTENATSSAAKLNAILTILDVPPPASSGPDDIPF